MKIICFVRNRFINQGCRVGEAISTAPAPTNPAPEKYDCYCDSGSEQNVLAPPAPALVLAKKSDTGGSCFCCMGHGPYFNYHLLTLANKFSGAGGSSFIPRTDTGGSSFISDPGCWSTSLIQTDVFVIGWESWPTLSNVGVSFGNMTLVNRVWSGRDRSTALRGGTKKAHLTFAISNSGYKVVQITLFSYIRAESKVLRNGYLA